MWDTHFGAHINGISRQYRDNTRTRRCPPSNVYERLLIASSRAPSVDFTYFSTFGTAKLLCSCYDFRACRMSPTKMRRILQWNTYTRCSVAPHSAQRILRRGYKLEVIAISYAQRQSSISCLEKVSQPKKVLDDFRGSLCGSASTTPSRTQSPC